MASLFNPIQTESTTLFVAGVDYAFYVNLDELETNANFPYWQVNLYTANEFNLAASNIFVPTKDIISGTDYRWYANFTFPNVNSGCYYIVVIDTANANNVIYISNLIEVRPDETDLLKIRYRNPVNMENFNYEGLPTFKNEFHIEVITRQPQNNLDTEGFDLVDGTFQRVRTTKTKTYEFVTEFMGELSHDGLNTALYHNTFEVFKENIFQLFKLADSDYSPEWSENYGLAQATFRLQQARQSSTNKAI
jgi:hypothetical protein